MCPVALCISESEEEEEEEKQGEQTSAKQSQDAAQRQRLDPQGNTQAYNPTSDWVAWNKKQRQKGKEYCRTPCVGETLLIALISMKVCVAFLRVVEYVVSEKWMISSWRRCTASVVWLLAQPQSYCSIGSDSSLKRASWASSA